jgi:hypothetical protein
MLVDQPQAFTLALRKQLHGIPDEVGARRHGCVS